MLHRERLRLAAIPDVPVDHVEEEAVLERILYVSRAASGTDLPDVFEIGRAARLRNATVGVSGGIVFVDGWFAQALEGPVPALCDVYASILKDPRHVRVSLRSRERIFYRLFGKPGLILHTGSNIDPAVLRRFDYHFGFPVDSFPADVLLEFMAEICGPAACSAREILPAAIQRQA